MQPGGCAATVCGQTPEGAGPNPGAAPPSFLTQGLCPAALSRQGLGLQGRKGFQGRSARGGHLAEPCSRRAALAQSQCTIAITLAPARPANYAAALFASANGSALNVRKWAGLQRLLPEGLRGCTRSDRGGGRKPHAGRLGQRRRLQRGSEVQRAGEADLGWARVRGTMQ